MRHGMGGKERKRAKREQEVICLKVEISRVLEKLTSAQNLGLTKMTPPFEGIENFDSGLRRALDAAFDWKAFGDMLLHQIPARTLVFARGVFELRFALFLSPDEKDTLYCIGPWAEGPRSKESIAWCKTYLDEKAQDVIQEYHNRVRQIDDNAIKSTLFGVISLIYPEGELKTEEWREFMPLNFRPGLFPLPESGYRVCHEHRGQRQGLHPSPDLTGSTDLTSPVFRHVFLPSCPSPRSVDSL